MTHNPFPPAEWEHHSGVWIGFPSHVELWGRDIHPARDEVVAFARAVHADGRGEKVLLVVADTESLQAARKMAPFAEVVHQPFGDIWLRDTGPIMLSRHEARLFEFNGWGGKYDLPGDDDLAERLATSQKARALQCDWVLEGGAIDGDGTGRVITTEQCLLNRNRNPGSSKTGTEERLKTDLGFKEVIWLGNGLINDHTDGHVDNLARFVGPGRIAIPEASENDPNWRVYQAAVERVEFSGAEVEVVRVPSPGRVLHDEEIVPASYMNFYIGNAAVVVPLYGTENDAAAVEAFAAIFPDRDVVGLRADHILTGGGSFHCISQQIPG